MLISLKVRKILLHSFLLDTLQKSLNPRSRCNLKQASGVGLTIKIGLWFPSSPTHLQTKARGGFLIKMAGVKGLLFKEPDGDSKNLIISISSKWPP